MKKILPIILLLIGCSNPESKNTEGFLLPPEEFKTKIDEGAVLIDVRTVEEYNKGHISGAMNMNVNDASFKDNLQQFDKDKQYAVYCASGVRSGKAADLMRQLGFTKVYTLTGGIKSWKEKGMPVE